MIRNVLAGVGFLAVAMAGAAGVFATRWGDYDQPARLAVSVRGLDLTDPEGRRLLDQRVNSAINRVCADSSGGSFNYGSFDDRDCRRKARLGAEPQITRAIDRAFERQQGYRYDAPPPPPQGYYAPPPPMREPEYIPAPPQYVQPIDDSMRAGDGGRVVRNRKVTITRTPLAPRVKWVKTSNGVVKKTTQRKLVRKTVRTTTYTR